MIYSSIVITGSIAYDEIMDFPGRFVDYLQPEKLHQLNVSFVVDHLEKQLGGIATNIAYNLSLVGSYPVKVLGGVGKDGDRLIDFFRLHKIDYSGLLIDDKLYTATGTVITDKKDNQIWGYYYGASRRGKEIDISQHVDKKSLMVISANHPESFLHFQEQAISMGVNYLYDPGMALSVLTKEQLREGVLHCKWLIGNDYEIANIFRLSGLERKTLLGRNIVVITTLGEKGVWYQDRNEEHTISVYPIKDIVDPTGAGDAWRAGFISGIVEDKPIPHSLRLGNALASFAIESYGTVNHKPSKKEIENRMENL